MLIGQFNDMNNSQSPQRFNPSQRGGKFGNQKRRAKAPFSADGAVNDRTKSTIVVENIPEESFSEEAVRDFFAQFGNIVEVSMQPYKHLAIVKFDNWSAANSAYRSPKVIFDNRFVKVFWYKEDAASTGSTNGGGKPSGPTDAGGSTTGETNATQGPEIDMEEFARKQEEAQKAHEEKAQKMEEVKRQREELEKRQSELLAKQEEEKQKLLAKIAAKMANSTGSEGGEAKKPTSQTEALKAQLAALEAEAKQLGIDPDAVDDGSGWSSRGRGRGRGAPFRSRGYAPRGFRGSFRGRGASGHHAAYAAYSIDNRPKAVSITGVDFTIPEKDETLRQYLFVRKPHHYQC
jgi:RNA recognition motif-containing protein